ncbi:MAG: hypothetical protein AAB536_02820 [Patescibacteria group bacterium]
MASINPLEYHYKVGIKLDYFILSADIALLGWTIVNTEWLPKGAIFIWLIGGFWILIILSIVCGIFRQLYNGIVFGLNQQFLENRNREQEGRTLYEKFNNKSALFANLTIWFLVIALFLLAWIKIYALTM